MISSAALIPKHANAIRGLGLKSCLQPLHFGVRVLEIRKTMSARATHRTRPASAARKYVLDRQVGFILRQVVQRHIGIFTERMLAELTPTQFAALAKLFEAGPCSQNRLGRLTAMDAATIKGVIDRLTKRGFTQVRPDARDARLLMVHLTLKGRRIARTAIREALRITEETLAPLRVREQAELLKLLKKLC